MSKAFEALEIKSKRDIMFSRWRKSKPRPPRDIVFVRYGTFMLGGVLLVAAVKRVIRLVPVLGSVAVLVPTTLVGAALGAAAAYGVEKGDFMAAKRPVRRAIRQIKGEVKDIVRHVDEVQRDMQVQAAQAVEEVPNKLRQQQLEQRYKNADRELAQIKAKMEIQKALPLRNQMLVQGTNK